MVFKWSQKMLKIFWTGRTTRSKMLKFLLCLPELSCRILRKSGLKIAAGHWAMCKEDDYLSGQTNSVGPSFWLVNWVHVFQINDWKIKFIHITSVNNQKSKIMCLQLSINSENRDKMIPLTGFCKPVSCLLVFIILTSSKASQQERAKVCLAGYFLTSQKWSNMKRSLRMLSCYSA